ncbi:uncharacterized protein LOC114365370 isoform X2 [Ostrinia furnacalis]|uniref:uncharacterized protein LOC114365370 isoform X2 n=1 Tax=Ostrinia furnacalis TaxID=93504 RepID=UPI00103CAD34|nr:uncharacterized protein LOC114365370 isoform X2 [Ostrinia furnacalis]
MARRHIYTGMYTRLHRRPAAMAQNARQSPKDLRSLANLATQYVWAAYNMMNGNYLALATVIAVVLLSFLIPDISQKIHATSELKNMKKVLNLMTNEVSRAEVACLTAADEICYLHCSMHDGATETVSISPETLKTCQSAPATASDPPCPSPYKSKGRLVSSEEYSTPTETHPTKKSPSCPTYTRTHSTLKRR